MCGDEDVYKRQKKSFVPSTSQIKVSPNWVTGTCNISSPDCMTTIVVRLDIERSVSYTHLDVYKRQEVRLMEKYKSEELAKHYSEQLDQLYNEYVTRMKGK